MINAHGICYKVIHLTHETLITNSLCKSRFIKALFKFVEKKLIWHDSRH